MAQLYRLCFSLIFDLCPQVFLKDNKVHTFFPHISMCVCACMRACVCFMFYLNVYFLISIIYLFVFLLFCCYLFVYIFNKCI